MIKIKNNRKIGALFHYAHFICDCLFPEIINEIYKYREVIREKSINQTIGNFSKIYTEVMLATNTELLTDEFNNLDVDVIAYGNKEMYCDKEYFEIFRNYVFSRYEILNLEYDLQYPEVILVKRKDRISLIDDKYLSKINRNVSTGKERREINNILDVEIFLNLKYKNKFKSLFFEELSFEEQVRYFNSAKLIICAHGAVMSNMFFCKEGTKIIEVTCGTHFKFFDVISKILKLNHIKCEENNSKAIINVLKKM